MRLTHVGSMSHPVASNEDYFPLKKGKYTDISANSIEEKPDHQTIAKGLQRVRDDGTM